MARPDPYVPTLHVGRLTLHYFSGSAPGRNPETPEVSTALTVDSAGNLVLPDGFTLTGDLALGDNQSLKFGDADDILVSWNGTYLAVTQAAVNSAIKLGVSGAGIDLQLYGDTVGADLLWDQSADTLKAGDNAKIVCGTGGDLEIYHNATNTLINSITGNLVIDNQSATGATYMDLGTDTSATAWAVRNNSGTSVIGATGASTSFAVGLQQKSSSATAITTTRVLTVADSGGIFTVAQSSAYDIDLPSPTGGAGYHFLFQLVSPGAFNVTITVAGAAATFEGTISNAVTSVLPATGSTLTFASGVSVLGDNIEIFSTGTGKYFVRAITSAAGGITIS
jgi:hypothetical protein